MSKLKGAVLGFGGVGQSMTEFCNERDDVEIVIACNRGPEKLEIARNKFNLKTTHNAEEAIRDVDFVVVTSSNYAHKEQVMLAARHRKHIFCEKPVAVNLPDLKEMADAVDAAGVINVVNYSFRYNPAFILLKELIDQGEFGRVLSAWNLRLRDFGLYASGARHVAVVNPDESGRWAVHHLCHGIDMLYWWLGPMERVYAGMQSTVPEDQPYCEEVVHGLINFKCGAVGTVSDSVCIGREHHTGIIGTRATAILQGEGDDTTLWIKSEETKEVRRIKTIDKKPKGVGMGHFIDCLLRGAHSKATIRDSIPSIQAALAMQESAASGIAVALDG